MLFGVWVHPTAGGAARSRAAAPAQEARPVAVAGPLDHLPVITERPPPRRSDVGSNGATATRAPRR